MEHMHLLKKNPDQLPRTTTRSWQTLTKSLATWKRSKKICRHLVSKIAECPHQMTKTTNPKRFKKILKSQSLKVQIENGRHWKTLETLNECKRSQKQRRLPSAHEELHSIQNLLTDQSQESPPNLARAQRAKQQVNRAPNVSANTLRWLCRTQARAPCALASTQIWRCRTVQVAMQFQITVRIRSLHLLLNLLKESENTLKWR